MDESIRKRIMGIRSKYCEPILELLAKEGELYHGDLAEKLNIAPSGLNVIIKKMQEGDFPIIEIMQIGKYKIYTLPPEIKDYILNKHSERTVINETEAISRVEKEYDNVLLCMQYFVEKAGVKWKDLLNLMLQGNEDDIESEVQEAFDLLMKSIENASKYKEEQLDELNRFLNNDVLVYLIQSYLEELNECEIILAEIKARKNGRRLVRHFKIQ